MAKKSAKKAKTSKTVKSTAVMVSDDLSPAERKDADKRWIEMTKSLLNRRGELVSDTLQFYYDVGELADEVIATQGQGASPKARRKYGRRTVNDLAKALSYQSSTIYNCLRFFRVCDKKQLSELKKHGWAWRNVLALVTVEDSKARRQFQLDFQAGKYAKSDDVKDSDAFRKEITKYNDKQREAGTRNDNRGNRLTVLSPIKSAHAAVHKVVQEILPNLLIGVKELGESYDKVDPEQIAEARKQLREISKDLAAVEQVRKRYSELAEQLDLL